MEVVIRSVSEPTPGRIWQSLFEESWPAYQSWFLKEGDPARPSYAVCHRMFKTHMPELLPVYERLVELSGGGDQAARCLSLYCPTPYLSGCSQAVWSGTEPMLVRNYDYNPALWDALILHTSWNERSVIAMSDCLWGVLDGINDCGVAVSLSFGGRRVVGEGFGVPLVLRYVLEFCRSASEAVAILRRIPVHMAYNVTVLDADGEYATVQVSPDRPAVARRRPAATNHRGQLDWQEYVHATTSVEREHFLDDALRRQDETSAGFVQRFLHPPLFCTEFQRGWGTLYTAAYQTRLGTVNYLWPRTTCSQSFQSFSECEFPIRYANGAPAT